MLDEMLIRIPGIGTTYAQKIIEARRYCTITHDVLKKIGVSLKKSFCFITCDGKFWGYRLDNDYIIRRLLVSGNETQTLAEQLTLDKLTQGSGTGVL